MQPLVAVEDLMARLGVQLSPASPDYTRAEAALADASALVRSVAEQDWADEDGELDFGDLGSREVAALQSVTLSVAYRAYRNPDGAAQSSIGDVSVSFGNRGEGSVYLTPSERAQVKRAAGASSVVSVGLVTPWTVGASNYY